MLSVCLAAAVVGEGERAGHGSTHQDVGGVPGRHRSVCVPRHATSERSLGLLGRDHLDAPRIGYHLPDRQGGQR